MRFFALVFVSAILTGCIAVEEPKFINGNYYMAGGPNCRGYRLEPDNSILCVDSNMNRTGYRYPMTDQQIQMYMHEDNAYRESLKRDKTKHTTCSTLYGITSCTTRQVSSQVFNSSVLNNECKLTNSSQVFTQPPIYLWANQEETINSTAR